MIDFTYIRVVPNRAKTIGSFSTSYGWFTQTAIVVPPKFHDSSGTALPNQVVNSSELRQTSAQEKAWDDLEMLFARWDAQGVSNDDMSEEWLTELRSSWENRLDTIYGDIDGWK